MKRAIAWTLGTLLLLALLLLAATGWLLGSDSGTRTLLRQIDGLVPGLTLGSSEGDLLSELQLREIRFESEPVSIAIDHLLLRWSPAMLLNRELLLEELSVNTLRYSAGATEQPPAEPLQWPVELPNLKLPISVDIRKLEINDASFVNAPGAEPIQLDVATLVGRWDSSGVAIERLHASTPLLKATLSGQLNPTGDYVLSIDNQLQMKLANEQQFELKGSLVGNRHSLQLEQILSGGARAGLSLNLRRPLEEPAWTGQLDLVELPSSLLGMSVPINVAGSLVSNGSWPDAQLTGELETASEVPQYHQIQMLIEGDADLAQASARLGKLELLQQSQPMRLFLQGEVAADKTLSLSGDWRQLQWPLLGEPAFSSDEGKLAVAGSLDDYRFTAGAKVALPGVPNGQWQLSGSGNQQSINLEALQGGLLQGAVEAAGELAWAPAVNWKLSARGSGLQVSSLVPALDTAIGFRATSEGLVDDSGLRLQVVLADIFGTLNDQPLSGGGEIKHDGTSTQVRDVRFAVGRASATASGRLDANSDLQWALQVPALEDLLPESGGRLESRGTLKGPINAPSIRGTLTANNINYEATDITQLAADIKLDLQDAQPSSVTLDGSGLVLANQPVDSVQLTLRGYVRDHSIRLAVSQPEDAQTAARLALEATGGLVDALWRGTLRELSMAARPVGDWRLEKPFALTAGTSSAGAEPFCLRQSRGASLCAEGDWQAQGKTSGEFALSNLALAQFAEYFPASIVRLGGELSAEGKLNQLNDTDARISARVSPGELVVQDTSGDAQQLSHGGLELQADIVDKGTQGRLRSQVGTTTLEANARLPDLFAVADKNRARLEGELQLSAPDLELVASLVPAVTAIAGAADVDFRVTGQLGEPALLGQSTIAVQRLEVEQIGWEIDDASLNISADGNSLRVDGSIVSGGRVGIDGKLGLSAQQGWPLDMSLVGEDFAVMDLPNFQVYISPDLNIRHGADGFALTGEITVPRADITIHDLPAGAVSPSNDVVVLGDDGTARKVESNALVATDIKLTLSDKVSVAALGFEGFIEGKLRLRGKPSRPLLATGDVRVKEGTFRAYGQRLEIERGMLSYANSPVDNPGINIRATRQINEVQVGVDALGTARRMTVKTFSSPSMSENDRISYLVAGKPAREGASLSLEREIAKDLSVGVRVDTKTGESAFITRYRILRTLYAEVGSSARSSSLDLFYTLETD